jgi:hypothetical protein
MLGAPIGFACRIGGVTEFRAMFWIGRFSNFMDDKALNRWALNLPTAAKFRQPCRDGVNLAMAILITIAGLPVVAALTWTREANPVALVHQLVTMIFIWLGVGNVLSVIYRLRHEPMTARLKDGTWKPFLFSFAVSYGVGLTVNLMIYWRLWARQLQTPTSQAAPGSHSCWCSPAPSSAG